MGRYLPIIIWFGMLVYCLVDVAQTDVSRVRNLQKPIWIILIVLLPIAGGIAWLVAGRPAAAGTGHAGTPRRSGRTLGPDDDPDFLSGLGRPDPRRERALREWEEQQRRQREGFDGPGSDKDVPPA
jgi:hypothetical protein